MTNKNKIKLVACTMFFINAYVLNGQGVPYITIDPDGWTNIRKEPDARSEILGRAYKNQIFFSIHDHCGNDMFSTDSWEPVAAYGSRAGYIFKRNIFPVESLPAIRMRGDYYLFADNNQTVIAGSNDSITIRMTLQPFNRENHMERFNAGGRILGGGSDAVTDNLKYNLFKNEIVRIDIVYGEKRFTLPKERIIQYCDVGVLRLYIGNDGALYLQLAGGGDGGNYSVWFSIVNGEILDEVEDFWRC